jgi:hypothetical protein
MWKVNGRQTTDDGRQVMAKAHIAFGQAVSEEKIFKNLYRDNCILNTDIYI